MALDENKENGISNTMKVTAVMALMVLASTGITAKSNTRVELVRTCTAKNGAKIGNLVLNFTTHKSKTHCVVEGNALVLNTMKPPLPADISISRCRNSAGKECVTLLKYRHANSCPFFVTGNTATLWADFIDKFVPPVNCPIKQGNYYVNNGTFDGNKFSSYFQAVPGEQAKVTYFIIKLHSKVDDEEKICFEITFRQVRS